MGGYAKIVAVLVQGINQFSLSLEKITNIEDYNEITNHWINVMATSLARRRYREIEDSPRVCKYSLNLAENISEKAQYVRNLTI